MSNECGVKETRIDYMISNDMLTPCVESCRVDQSDTFPTHRPLMVEINTKKLSRQMRSLIKPTNFATMFEDSVQKLIKEARGQIEKDNEAKPQGEDEKTVDENAIRQSSLRTLHRLMDQQIQERHYRLKHAQAVRKTEQQWDLIAAAVEQAVIDFYQLKDAEAKKMRGRSRITFQKKKDKRAAV